MPEIQERAFDWLKNEGKLDSQQRRLLELIRDWPDSTDAELSQLLATIDHVPRQDYVVSRARETLLLMGKIGESGERTCGTTGRPANTWRIRIRAQKEMTSEQIPLF